MRAGSHVSAAARREDRIDQRRAGGAAKRLCPPALTPAELPPVDVVCVTHDHFDHLDLPSIRALGSAPLYVVPLGLGRLLRGVGAERVVELDWWESTRDGDLEITLTPARHWSMRMPWTRNESLWGGFVLRGPEGALYHSGDTALFDGFRDIGARLGPIDWALLPIGAYEPRWFMEPQHMDPGDAVEAFVRLGAAHFFAMHWGTFVLTDEPVEEPPARLRELWRERALDPARLAILDVGESRPLG
jgi:N-acyl-phosphatidylethanolamine-hydrolysing phospholipase D